MNIGAPDYNELGRGHIDRFSEGFQDKRGVEETMDREMGPDVRYALSRDDIDLVKRYLMGPVTPAEYRELQFKLRQLQTQTVGHERVSRPWNEAVNDTVAKTNDEVTLYLDDKREVDLVA